jgi:hypothetical protein
MIGPLNKTGINQFHKFMVTNPTKKKNAVTANAIFIALKTQKLFFIFFIFNRL